MRHVGVHRFVSRDTIEEKIMEHAEAKLELHERLAEEPTAGVARKWLGEK